MFDDRYRTINNTSEGVFRDKGSKFIAFTYPFKQEHELKTILAALRAQHQKARHFCWAYRLGPDRTHFRINDDGEPSGTAGRPILNVLLSADLTNILVVVVRYFGGTLLGVPGLIHAYKSATLEALANAVIIEKTLKDAYEVTFDYLQMNDIMRILKEEQLSIISQQFDNECKIKFEVPKMQLNGTISKLEKINGVKLIYLHTI